MKTPSLASWSAKLVNHTWRTLSGWLRKEWITMIDKSCLNIEYNYQYSIIEGLRKVAHIWCYLTDIAWNSFHSCWVWTLDRCIHSTPRKECFSLPSRFLKIWRSYRWIISEFILSPQMLTGIIHYVITICTRFCGWSCRWTVHAWISRNLAGRIICSIASSTQRTHSFEQSQEFIPKDCPSQDRCFEGQTI